MISDVMLEGIANEGWVLLYEEQLELAQELLRARQRIRELEEAQRWIPVTEKLPENENRYECIGVVGKGFATLCTFKNEKWLMVIVDVDCTEFVTHWRQLPPPPEVE